jgi:hypothetical protein
MIFARLVHAFTVTASKKSFNLARAIEQPSLARRIFITGLFCLSETGYLLSGGKPDETVSVGNRLSGPTFFRRSSSSGTGIRSLLWPELESSIPAVFGMATVSLGLLAAERSVL